MGKTNKNIIVQTETLVEIVSDLERNLGLGRLDQCLVDQSRLLARLLYKSSLHQ